MNPGLFALPRLYAILDHEMLLRRGVVLSEAAAQLRDAGCTLMQYRNKTEPDEAVLGSAVRLSAVLAGSGCMLLLNDRAHLAALAGCDGVHVGQADLQPEDARRVLGPGKLVGLSTHTIEQVQAATERPIDYMAIGPVFRTSSKHDAEPAVGLAMVRRARALTSMPLVAIGGITHENAADVIEAGADAVAVIGALFVSGESLASSARSLLRRLA